MVRARDAADAASVHATPRSWPAAAPAGCARASAMAKLRVRSAKADDAAAIVELHERHGKEFYLPDPSSSDNIVACVVEDEHGAMVGAVILHVTVEGHFLLDKTYGTPADRWELARVMYEEGCRFAKAKGFRDAFVAIPRMLRGYIRRVATLAGFQSDDYRMHFKVKFEKRFAA